MRMSIANGNFSNKFSYILVGRNLIRDDSPHSIGDSPKLTPSPPSTVPANIHQENVGGTTYFYPTTANHAANQTNNTIESSMPLSHYNSTQDINYTQSVNVYPGPLGNIVNMQPRTQLSSAFFTPSDYRNEILNRNDIANMIETTPNPG